MRISRKKRPEKIDLNYRINEEIQAPRLRVVDEDGTFLGIMQREEALAISREREKDLIEIVPKVDVPVAKLTEYGKFKYQKEKELKKQKSQQKKISVKGIRLSLRIGKHDIEMRIRQAIEFLRGGDKVRAELILRGREKAHPEIGHEVIKDFIDNLGAQSPIKVEQPTTRQGAKFFAIIAPSQSIKAPRPNGPDQPSTDRSRG